MMEQMRDGSLMGLLRFANVPLLVVICHLPRCNGQGCSTSSFIAKYISCAVYLVCKSTVGKHREEILNDIKKLSWPMFVKPVHLGSSIDF